ncbi:MAG: hypothetical protein GY801_06380 [bacterium]|nr:hypothetical protein [bacterium]
MPTIALEDNMDPDRKLFGDAESVIKAALKAYSIEQCQQRIQNAAEKAAVHTQKYQREYEQFAYAVQTDENVLQEVATQYPVWEEDAMEWKYWTEEQQTWQSRLKAILQT